MIIITNASTADVCSQDNADAYFCTRYVCLSIIAIFTGLLCIGKIAKYHYNKVKCLYQLSIFYCATGECICFVVHWTVWPYDVTENMGYWFRIIQLLILCVTYSKLAARVLDAEEQYKRRYLPVLSVFALYYIALIGWIFFVQVPPHKFKFPHKCVEFHHPCYTVSDFVLAQVFLVCGVHLTRKMALVHMPSEQFLDQKKQLWGVIVAFETEAIISVVYDIMLEYVAAGPDNANGCGGFLYQHNPFSVIAFIVIRSVRLFVAVWFMLYTFDAQSTDYAEAPVYTYDEEDSLDAYMANRSHSIVPYTRDSNYSATEPLLQENTFENYLPNDSEVPFGARTNNKLILNAEGSEYNTEVSFGARTNNNLNAGGSEYAGG